MTTSVWQPAIGLQAKMRERRIRHTTSVLKVKRVLFEPPDHDQAKLFVEDELSKHYIAQSIKWNFDFDKETTLDPDGVYDWMPATPERLAKPNKHRLVDADDDDDNDDDAMEAAQFYFEPISAGPREKSKIQSSCVTQRLITDFMASKKIVSDFVKKSPSSERPLAKIPRLSKDCSS